MAAGEQEGGDGAGGEGRGRRESLLVQVDFLVPFAPGFGRGEHSAGATHVAEGGLAGAVGAAAGDAGDTGHGATWRRGLVGGD